MQDDSSADEEDPIQPEPIPPTPPDIPQAISYPADQGVPEPGENDFVPGPSVSDPEDSRFAQAGEMPFVSTEFVHQSRQCASVGPQHATMTILLTFKYTWFDEQSVTCTAPNSTRTWLLFC